MPPITFPKFLATWLPALAVSSSLDPAPRLADAFTVQLGGVTLPPVTCVLGVLGVVMARPLVRKSEATLSLPAFLLVSAILLVMVELWIVDSRPGALFAFVMAIGAGFSGYSIIELAGDQVRALASRLMPSPPSDGDAK